MNYLKTIFRKALKKKGTTALNLLGLTTGFVCSLLLVSWIIHESTFDSFVKDKDKIYRVILQGVINNEEVRSAGCMRGIAAEAVKQIPEVESSLTLDNALAINQNLIKAENKKFFHASGFASDENFFDFFPYKLIDGTLHNALQVKGNIVIVKSLANKCFGNETAIGENLTVGEKNYTVVAVIDDIPSNSHLQFQYVIPVLSLYGTMSDFLMNQWSKDNSTVYLKLNSKNNIETVGSKITTILLENVPQMKNFQIQLKLQQLKDIPFDNNFKFDSAKKTSKRNIYILSIIAFLIIFIASINFSNLFISSALKRKKEIGIKISNGANKFSIAKEYLIEVLMYVLLSLLFSILLVKIIHPFFIELTGENVEINFFDLRFLAVSIPLIVVTTLFIGLIPGIFLYRINISDILKGGNSSIRKLTSYNILTTSQFIIAIVLVLGMLGIYKQVDFLHSKSVGFDKENILFFETNGILKNRKEQQKIKDELSNYPNIKEIAFRGAIPTKWASSIMVSASEEKLNVNMERIFVDENYFNLSNIKFVEGSNVITNTPNSLNYCIINEKAGELSGLQPPYLDKMLYSINDKQQYIIKGVVKNINTKSLVQSVDPCIYMQSSGTFASGIIMFKLTGDITKGIDIIKSYFESEISNQLFEYQFLDDTYKSLYKSEEKARTIISLFTVVALILTFLGLLAMVYFVTQQRTKEIGIRKVNGAKSSEILIMLNRNFIKWVVLAYVIAGPIAYYILNKWLEQFAYKTILSWWVFVIAGVFTIGTALLTVSWQSWRTAIRNPVEALRYE